MFHSGTDERVEGEGGEGGVVGATGDRWNRTETRKVLVLCEDGVPET